MTHGLINSMHQQRGFTLVELIVVIVLTGIMAGSVTVFFKPAVDSYFATLRRAALADTADTALRRMVRETRSAVPNSILEHSGNCIEFVPSKAGGRYRMAAHVTDAGIGQENTAQNCSDTNLSCALDLTEAETAQKTAFDVLQLSQSMTPQVGDFIVIGNQEPDQVYAGTNRKVISAFNALPAGNTFGTHRISLGNGSFNSAQGYDMGRFSITPSTGSVAFVCSGTGTANGQGTGTLYRVVRAPGTTTPNSCPAVTGFPVLADKVAACNFVYSSNAGTQQNGLVWMEVTLTDSDESVNLAFGAHVSNVP